MKFTRFILTGLLFARIIFNSWPGNIAYYTPWFCVCYQRSNHYSILVEQLTEGENAFIAIRIPPTVQDPPPDMEITYTGPLDAKYLKI